MRLSLSKRGSLADARARWLVATWGKPGAAFLGGKGTPRPEGSFCFLLDSDDGSGTMELLLDSSTTGVDEYCLQLDTST